MTSNRNYSKHSYLLCVSTTLSTPKGGPCLLCARKKLLITKILRDLKERYRPKKALALAGPGFSCFAFRDWNHRGPVMKQFHTTAYALQCQSCHPCVRKVQHAVGGKLDILPFVTLCVHSDLCPVQ